MRFVATLGVLCLLMPAGIAFGLEGGGGMDLGGVDSSSHSSASGIGANSSGGTYSSSGSTIDARLLTTDSGPGPEGTGAGGLANQCGHHSENKEGNGPTVAKQASHYFLSRWYDLCDIVDFSVGGGPGFLINARATKMAQFGFGYSDAYRVGFRGRSAGFWREKRMEAGVSLLYYQKIRRERITGWVENFRSDKMDLDTSAVYANTNDRAFTGVGFTVHALVLVDVNVRPMQAFDFVLGLMTIDILDDDTGHPHRNKDL